MNHPCYTTDSHRGQNKWDRLRLQWVPGHCDDLWNDTADRLAKEAARPGKTHSFRPLFSREQALIRDKTRALWEQEWKTSNKDGHLRRIDPTLPSTYTRGSYGSFPRSRVYLLTQLRTAHSWLSTYAKAHRFQEDDKCVCGAQETLWRKVGYAFNSVSSLLGGCREGKIGKCDNASQASTMETVLDFAEASQRFRSRAP